MPASAIVIKLRTGESVNFTSATFLLSCAKFSRRYLRRLTARREQSHCVVMGAHASLTISPIICECMRERAEWWCTRAHYQQQQERPLKMIGSRHDLVLRNSFEDHHDAQFGRRSRKCYFVIESNLNCNQIHNSIWPSVHSTEHILPNAIPLWHGTSLCAIIWYHKQLSFDLLANQWPARDSLMFIDASCYWSKISFNQHYVNEN